MTKGKRLTVPTATARSSAAPRARRDLKAALADKWDSAREEQQRIAEILQRAAAEILRR